MLDDLLSQPQAYGVPALCWGLAWTLERLRGRREGLLQRSLERFSERRALKFGSYYLLRKLHETEAGWVFEAWSCQEVDAARPSEARGLEGFTLSARTTAGLAEWARRHSSLVRLRIFRPAAWQAIRSEVALCSQLENPGLPLLAWGERQGLGYVASPQPELAGPFCLHLRQSPWKIAPPLWFGVLRPIWRTLQAAQQAAMTCQHFSRENIVWLVKDTRLTVSFDFGLPAQGHPEGREATLQQKLSALAQDTLQIASPAVTEVLKAMARPVSPYPDLRSAQQALLEACDLTPQQKAFALYQTTSVRPGEM